MAEKQAPQLRGSTCIINGLKWIAQVHICTKVGWRAWEM